MHPLPHAPSWRSVEHRDNFTVPVDVPSLVLSNYNGVIISAGELTRSDPVIHILPLDPHYAEITVINFICGIAVISSIRN
jgi:hypothetical protein